MSNRPQGLFQKEAPMARAIATKTRNALRTRSLILGAGFNEIYKKGFRAASINEIIKETKLTKGAFFHHFPTKESLGYAIADEILFSLVRDRWLLPLDEYENPVEGITQNFKKIIDETPQSHLGLGCPLNNLVQEMTANDPIFAKKLSMVIEYWTEGIKQNLLKAQKRGYLKRGVNLQRLAEFIVMSHEGAFGLIKITKDRKAFLGLNTSLKEYLLTFSKG
jgi:TetR/AcrR family transcriptional repressor of nem operon